MQSSGNQSPFWRKSSRSSDPTIAACVELAAIDDRRAIRDSKNPAGPQLSFSVAELSAFVSAVKRDAYEL